MTNVTIGSGPDGIILDIAEDAYLGDAQFTISVDGQQIGGVLTASALQSAGQQQIVTVLGNFAPVGHTVSVDFLNDLYAYSPRTDRNLYVDGIESGGVSYPGVALYSSGPVNFVVGNNFQVSDSASLNAAIDAADAAVSGNVVIQFASNIIENAMMDAINLHAGVTLTIEGNGHGLNGADTYRGLFAYAGVLTVQNLVVFNTIATGGAGGGQGAGGGAGLGGGLFVAGTNAGLASGASVMLNNVTFGNDQAVGGAGNGGGGWEGHYGPYGNGGGGGGMGGIGGSYSLSGGGGGGIGGAGGSADAGAAGIVLGAASGGSSGVPLYPVPTLANAGGANGGGGGGGVYQLFALGGGGGVGGTAPQTAPLGSALQGGAGGFGGGGGGGGQIGGDGGFGGGGGSRGGNGGFGGGSADGGTSAGFGGGAGSVQNLGFSNYDGGGGLGAGGAIFVQQGGSLTISGGTVANSSVAGGAGGFGPQETAPPVGSDGLGLGAGIFLQGNQTIIFNESLGQNGTISDVIADQTGSGGTGATAGGGIVSLTGLGRLTLSAADTYSGGTLLNGGTLELDNAQAAGTGNITFASGADARLQIDSAALDNGGILANAVSGFALGDSIDFAGVPYSLADSAVFDGQMLSIVSGGISASLSMNGLAPGTQFITRPDAHGRVLVSQVAGVVDVGSGPDTIGAYISEDAYQGNAQFTVSVNGTQIGGVQTATSLHASGQDELFAISGDFGSGAPALTVNFLNDIYAGTPSTDRNLYVDSINNAGTTTISNAALYSAGPASFILPAPVPVATVIGTGPDSIGLQISEDSYVANGGKDALFTVAVDGVQIGGIQAATAAHALGDTQLFSMLGNFGGGAHIVTVNFLNDAYGGTPTTDRNLYVGAITNAGVISTFNAALYSQGSHNFQV